LLRKTRKGVTVRVVFHERTLDAKMDTTDWIMPPRVGDRVFLIGDAKYESRPKASRAFQFDAVVVSVTFFGHGMAVAEVQQREEASNHVLPEPKAQGRGKKLKDPKKERKQEFSSGITQTVKWLRANGFNVCDAGDGGASDMCSAYVHMHAQPEELVHEAKRLLKLLMAKGIQVSAFDPETLDGGPNIQAHYDPAGNTAELAMFNVKL
jgi:hypothetical protein